jgi:hypothetical protein
MGTSSERPEGFCAEGFAAFTANFGTVSTNQYKQPETQKVTRFEPKNDPSGF